MEASEGGIKSEAQSQMSIRSAKSAILLSSLNRQLRSLANNNRHRHQNDGTDVVLKLKREVEDLKIQLVREKAMSKKMNRTSIWMKFLILQFSCFMLTFALCFALVYFSDEFHLRINI